MKEQQTSQPGTTAAAANFSTASGKSLPAIPVLSSSHFTPASTARVSSSGNDGIIQPVWQEQEGGISRWDALIDGKRWYYNGEKYYYLVEDESALLLMTPEEFADKAYPDSYDETEKDAIIFEIKKAANKKVNFRVYHTKSEIALLTKAVEADPREGLHKVDDPFLLAVANYLTGTGSFFDVLAVVFKSDNFGEGLGKTAKEAFDSLIKKDSVAPRGSNKFTYDGAIILQHAEGVYATNLYPENFKAQFNKAMWAKGTIMPEAEDLFNTGGSGKHTGLRAKTIMVDNIAVNFTARVEEKAFERVLASIRLFRETMLQMSDPVFFGKQVLARMQPDFIEALNAKDTSIGVEKGTNNNESVGAAAHAGLVDGMDKETPIYKENIDKYIAAVSKAWAAFLGTPVNILFDSAGSKDQFGKATENSDANPEKMMKGEDVKLAGKALAIINLDSHPENRDIVVTLAHECAHMIGFNPSECETSGHFDDSTKYLVAEKTYGPKLLFDAYYFEILVRRLLG